MGNKITTAEHANSCYIEFMKTLVGKGIEPVNLAARSEHEFAVFVEDLVVNDESVQDFCEEEKIKFFGVLCYYYCQTDFTKFPSTSSFPTTSSVLDLKNNPFPRFLEAIGKAFCNETSPEDFANAYAQNYFAWNGSNFFIWNTSEKSWNRCSVDEVSLSDLANTIFDMKMVNTCGLTSELVSYGVGEINKYLDNLYSSYADSESLGKVLSFLRKEPSVFDGPSQKLPCYSVVVEETSERRGVRDYHPSDKFTIANRLDYDPINDPINGSSELVSNFVDKFNCDEATLATVLFSAGMSSGDNLTVISGPKGSGRSTILRVIKALYGPFVCTQQEYENGTAGPEARTCLIDESSFPSEKEVREHRCKQLIVTCESTNLSGVFSGRTLRTLKLNGVIDEGVSNIVEKLSTRKQLGHLLNWCCSTSLRLSQPEEQDNGSSLDKFCEMLWDHHGKCGNSEHDCSHKHEENNSSFRGSPKASPQASPRVKPKSSPRVNEGEKIGFEEYLKRRSAAAEALSAALADRVRQQENSSPRGEDQSDSGVKGYHDW